MRRREFIATLGGAAAWPLAAHAQQSGKIPRVGVLWHAGNEQEEAIYLGALRKGLNDLGYVEGKNIELLNRFADEHYDRFDVLAKDLIDAKVDVIVASTSAGALAAKRISSTTPVVFAIAPDPVGQHLVDSLARPGGNVTGFSVMATDFIGKNLAVC
jgi:putative tryptophan/tyrosine transport system substrate-binding protein